MEKEKKICMVLDSDYPDDIRIKKEVKTLTKYGYYIFILCLRFNKKQLKKEYNNKITISRFYLPRKIALISRGLINTFFDYYTFFWVLKICGVIKKNNIKIIHLHDLYLFKAGIYTKKICNKRDIKLVGDLHENYIEAIKEYIHSRRFLSNFIMNFKRWSKKEVKWIRQFDSVISVIEEAQSRLEKKGIEKEKIYLVPNYADMNELNKLSINHNLYGYYKKYYNILYLGGINRHRGLTILIDAVKLLKNKINNLKCIIVGGGSFIDDIKKYVKDLNLYSVVDILGGVPFNDIRNFIEISNICIIPHLKNSHTDTTIPHKLFQYMYFKKPVIVSDCIPLRRIVSDSQCGLVYESYNHNELSNNVIKLFNDSMLERDLGINGRKAVIEKYNWKISEDELTKLYRNL